MCSHFESPNEDRLRQYFGVHKPECVGNDIWPGQMSTFIFRSKEANDEIVAQAGIFGLIPHWAKDINFSHYTFNTRIETINQKPSFKDAWHRSQRCIIPAEAIFEPDWSSGKSVPTRIVRADHKPMGIAGLWSVWGKEKINSFTMLTINANDNAFMRRFHKPGKEKRTVIFIPNVAYQEWFEISNSEIFDFINWSTDNLVRMSLGHRCDVD